MIIPSTDLSKYDLTDDTSAISPAYAAGLIRAILANGTAQGTLDGFDLSDTSSVVTPKYAARAIRALMQQGLPPIHLLTRVIGVCDDGTRSAHGMGLKWIDEDYNDIESLPDNFFDTHPSWQFPSYDIGGCFFNKIPIAYTKRGTVPSGPNAGKFYMMLSPTERSGFAHNKPAFRSYPYFFWGTYRARLGKGNVSLNQFIEAAEGSGYLIGSFQQYHEILMRAVIERKTFDVWTDQTASDYNANIYRGIHEMAYDGGETGISFELRTGVRLDSARHYEVFDDSNRYIQTNYSAPQDFGYFGSLLDEDSSRSNFHNMFFPYSITTIEQCIIPDVVESYTGDTIGMSNFRINEDSVRAQGAFSAVFGYRADSETGGQCGARLAAF